MPRAKDHELILWDGALYRRVDEDEHAEERARRHLYTSELVADEDLLFEGRVIKAGEVIPPPPLDEGFPLDIAVCLPSPPESHERLVKTGQAHRVPIANRLVRRRRTRKAS